MKSQGIRIQNTKDLDYIDLMAILKEIRNGKKYYWSILFLDVIGDLREGRSVPELESFIRKSNNGLLVSWDELNNLAEKFEQIIDITIIGSEDIKSIHRYDLEKDMYESCDIVIEMIDGSYWEVFSNDNNFIERLKTKFKKTSPLKTDFLNQS